MSLNFRLRRQQFLACLRPLLQRLLCFSDDDWLIQPLYSSNDRGSTDGGTPSNSGNMTSSPAPLPDLPSQTEEANISTPSPTPPVDVSAETTVPSPETELLGRGHRI